MAAPPNLPSTSGWTKRAPSNAPKSATPMGSPKKPTVMVLTKPADVRQLYAQLRKAERSQPVNLAERDQLFVRLADRLLKELKQAPYLIASHRITDAGEMSFKCAWIIDREEAIEGWFPGALLQEHCPGLLAHYLSRLHVPDHRATYRVWTRKPSPVRQLQLSPYPASPTPPIDYEMR